MLISNVQSRIVGATNNGFGGSQIGVDIVRAAKLASNTPALEALDDNHMAKAMNKLMPATHSSNVSEARSINTQMTPGIGNNEPQQGR